MLSRILLLSAFVSPAAAQTFEVASIKPSPASAGPRTPMTTDPSRIVYNNFTAKALVQIAYRKEAWAISGGPSWLNEDRYDLTASLPAGSKESQVPAMLQALLAERFQITIRNEAKDLPVYRLIVGKKGPKLKPGEAGEMERNGATRMVLLRGHIILPQCPMGMLAGVLSGKVGRPVLDDTNLKETYSIDLKYAPDDAAPGSKEAGDPTIFMALDEQLGLKLESTKAPVDILVITRISKPSAN